MGRQSAYKVQKLLHRDDHQLILLGRKFFDHSSRSLKSREVNQKIPLLIGGAEIFSQEKLASTGKGKKQNDGDEAAKDHYPFFNRLPIQQKDSFELNNGQHYHCCQPGKTMKALKQNRLGVSQSQAGYSQEEKGKNQKQSSPLFLEDQIDKT